MNPFQERAKRPASVIAGPYGHPFHAAVVPVPIGAFIVRVADEGKQAHGFDDVRGLVPPAVSGAGRVDRVPGTNVPVDKRTSR